MVIYKISKRGNKLSTPPTHTTTVNELSDRSEKVINTQEKIIVLVWDKDISGCRREQSTDISFQRGETIDSNGSRVTSAALKRKFSTTFQMRHIKAFRARFSWSLSVIKVRREIVIYKRKASSVQNKLNKDSSPTLIRLGMFFKNLYHRAESNSGTLDWIDFKVTDFF